jgi:disulfide oxidoreductase YuzD
MIKNTYFNKTLGENVTKNYDSQKYVKRFKCPVCECCITRNLFNVHKKTNYHIIAEKLRNESKYHINDIRNTILEYKIKEQQLAKINKVEDNLTSSDEEILNHKSHLMTLQDEKKIKHKSNLYFIELEKKAEKYEGLKAIPRLVETIKNLKKRITTVQKDKYYYLLNKYPDNELLLSIKKIVPEIEEPKPIKPIKQTKKKVKKVDDIFYPLVKYEHVNVIPSNDNHVLNPVKYEDNIDEVPYPIIVYEDKILNNIQHKCKTVYEIINYKNYEYYQ